VEDYLGIVRQDTYDGGQLIEIYEDYLRTRSEYDLKVLLLHNDEDVRNMPRLLAILRLREYMEANYSLMEEKLHTARRLDGSSAEELLVTLHSPLALPRPISLRLENGPYLTAAGQRISLALPLPRLSLKHFFDNPSDYFYLPDEDRAIHKSVGIYVEKEHRSRATRDNCYTRREGLFLPCPPAFSLQDSEIPEAGLPIFRQSRREKASWLTWEKDSHFSEKFWNAYIHCMWGCRH